MYYLKGSSISLNEKFARVPPNQIKISAMVEAELFVGVEKGSQQITRLMWERFIDAFEIIPFDDAAARHYAVIRAYLERSGTIIGPNDLIIAATVLAHNGVLVTHNVREFTRVPNLCCEDWTL
jgi:tRNA(fMet)-specific endonuclease VapC